MKKANRWISLGCGAVVALGCFAGCKNGGEAANTLTIRIANMGFGVEFLERIAEEFEKIYNVDVDVKSTVIIDSDLTKLETGYEMEDIFFCSGSFKAWETMQLGKFEMIDDVWESIPEGEEKPLKEKTLSAFSEYSYKYKDHYYLMPMNTEVGGLAYNKTVLDELFGEGQWKLPNTTNELTSLAYKVKAKDAWAFSWTTDMPYWELPSEVWAYQYNGIDAQTMYNQGYYLNADDEWVFSQNGECLKQNEGEYRRLRILDEYIDKGNGLSSSFCNAMDFMESQMVFAGMGYGITDSKKAAFAPTGAWLYCESREDFVRAGTDPGFFNVVLSDCVEKLSFYAESEKFYELDATQQAKYDGALSAIINWVDSDRSTAKPTTYEGITITEEDIEKVEEMRLTRYYMCQSAIGIPTNAKNKDLAKKFLTFYGSDYAGQIYLQTSYGFSPFYYQNVKIDESAPKFVKDTYAMLQGNTKTPALSSLMPLNNIEGVWSERAFFDKTLSSTQDRNTPEKAFNNIYVAKNTKNWAQILIKSGIEG